MYKIKKINLKLKVMMLAIAIILGAGVFGQVLYNRGDFNLFSGAALVIALFTLNTVLATVILSILSMATVMVLIRENSK